jgi:hypothetical protein
MKRIAALGLLLVAAGGLLVGSARTAPKPSEVASSWQLDIDFQAPRAIAVSLPGREKPQLFWYVLYTVTNNTNDEQVFVPNFVLYTDTGEILQGGKSVPASVFDAIKARHKLSLLKDMTSITGHILRGDDNAKDGVGIWPDFDPNSGQFDIFVGGLSGETAEVSLPEGKTIQATEIDGFGKEQVVSKNKMIVSKTLRLHYAVPGEASARLNANVKLLEKEWVMR